MYISYLPIWLVKSYGSEVLLKFDPEVQELALSIEWRESMLLYLDKVEIEEVKTQS